MKIFALTIFTGAFLLFQVQPMIAKYILPWFGGGPGVWTTCLLFFQVFLLAGYAYAHWTSRHLAVRAQAVLHSIFLLGALLFLPIVPGEHWKPLTAENPSGRILLLLTLCLGLPYFVLGATGPLLQAWFSRLHPGVVPYRLYALSNVGSFLALLTYPFVVEPAFSRRTQAGIWAGSFGVFALLCAACAWRLWHAKAGRPAKAKSGKSPVPSGASRAPATSVMAWWFGLSACGSVLLLATTNKLCLDMPAVPFLWVLPLGLYLLTFVICFDRPAWYVRKVFVLLLVPFLALLCYAIAAGHGVSLRAQIFIYGGNLLVGCLICHGEVYRLKPAPDFLTSFYLLIAAGGAAGGVFVGLLAPLLFRSYAELNWGFWILAAMITGIYLREKIELQWRRRRWPLWPVLMAGVMALGAVLLHQSRRAARDTISMSRNFYGVFRVVDVNTNTPLHVRKLDHGNTTHGLQFTDSSSSALATLYYNEPSGAAVALANLPRQTNRRVGLVGLGVGTLAAYGRPGDTFRFYEINPEVQRLAETHFTFLRDSAAHVEVVPGDARLSLEREVAQDFDLLVLDAFSSDSIPVHLLTREAFEIYLRHLKSDGAIAVHISSRHVNLLPVTVGVAKQFQQLIIKIAWNDPAKPWWFSGSTWVILSRNEPFMLSEPMMSRATMMLEQDAEDAFLWTDDYVSLFRIVRF